MLAFCLLELDIPADLVLLHTDVFSTLEAPAGTARATGNSATVRRSTKTTGWGAKTTPSGPGGRTAGRR